MNIQKALDNLDLVVVKDPDNNPYKIAAVLMFPISTFDYAYNHFRTIDCSSFRQMSKKLHKEADGCISVFWKRLFKGFTTDEQIEVTDLMDMFQEELQKDIDIIFFCIDAVLLKEIDTNLRNILTSLIFVWLLTDMTEVYFKVVGLKKYKELTDFNVRLKRLIISLEKEWIGHEVDFNKDKKLRNAMVIFMNKSNQMSKDLVVRE